MLTCVVMLVFFLEMDNESYFRTFTGIQCFLRFHIADGNESSARDNYATDLGQMLCFRNNVAFVASIRLTDAEEYNISILV